MTQPVVGLSPERLLRSGHGLWSAHVLQAALGLGVFTELGRGPRTRAQLQRSLRLREPGAADLLDTLLGLGWLEREGDDDGAVYVNSREAGHYLDARSAAAVGRWLPAAFALATPVAESLAAVLRGDAAAPLLPLADDTLQAWAALVGAALAQRLPLAQVHGVLGIGGGAVPTLCALAAVRPHLHALALVAPQDLAAVRDEIGARVLAARLRAQAQRLPWPRADHVLVHRWWPDQGDDQLAAAREALGEGGRLLWIDHWLDDARRDSAAALMVVLRRRLAGHAVHADTVRAARDRCLAAGFARTDVAPLGGGLAVVQAFA